MSNILKLNVFYLHVIYYCDGKAECSSFQISQETFIILSVAKYFCANFIYIFFFLLWI